MNTNYKITIPPVTHPLGKHWEQPDLSAITLTETRALMVDGTFKKLADYSCSIPTGVYAGKMWKACVDGQWYLRWYTDHPTIANRCVINFKPIYVLGS